MVKLVITTACHAVITGSSPVRVAQTQIKGDIMNTSSIGNIGEAQVLYEFVKRGIPVYTPFGDGYEVDLIAIFNGKPQRIQVKTTQTIKDKTLMEWNIMKQQGFHGNKISYSAGTIDYFALYCAENQRSYLVPFNEIPNSTFSIRLDSYDGRRLKTMHFEEDYQFDKILQ